MVHPRSDLFDVLVVDGNIQSLFSRIASGEVREQVYRP
jgi:hypothetical protein